MHNLGFSSPKMLDLNGNVLLHSLGQTFIKADICWSGHSSKQTFIKVDIPQSGHLSKRTFVKADICWSGHSLTVNKLVPSSNHKNGLKLTHIFVYELWCPLVGLILQMSTLTNVCFDECPLWWMSALMNVRFDECPLWWMSALTNVRFDECLLWWMSALTNVRFDECLLWQMSALTNARFDKYPLWRMSALMNVRFNKCRPHPVFNTPKNIYRPGPNVKCSWP